MQSHTLPLHAGSDDTADPSAQLEAVRQKATEMEQSARQFIRRNPTAALVGALALGFLVGRLVTR